MSAIEKMILAARADVGVTEQPRGSNSGPKVNQYLAVVGLGPGYPWCAAAVTSWGVAALGPAWPLPRTADCDVLLATARKKGVLHQAPQVGDIFLRLAAPGSDDAVHTGLVVGVGVNKDGAATGVQTIEGNTNTDGSSEGYGVFLRSRPVSPRLVYVRWAALVDEAAEQAGFVTVGGKSLGMQVDAGAAWMPLRAFLGVLFGDAVNRRLGWSQEEAGPVWDGAPLPFRCRLIDGAAWCPVRAAATWQGLETQWDAATTTARLTRQVPPSE